MSRMLIPNTTQVPNVILDEVIPKLACGPVRVLLAIIRLTYGYQKASDRLSLSFLAKKTGLSRRRVIEGVKSLGDLIKITPGKKGIKTWEGANEYSLNLDISTGQLNSLCSAQNVTSDENGNYEVPKTSPSQTNTSKPILRAPKNRTPKPPKKETMVGGFKEAMGLYHDLFVAKVGAKPDIDKVDGKILSDLLKRHGVDEVKGLLTFFFKKPPDWVEEKGKLTLMTFKGIYTELLARWKKPDTGMREF